MLKSIHSASARAQLRSVGVTNTGAWARLANVGAVVLCVVGAFAATWAHSPANMSYVMPDGGVFLYVAQRLREGAVLYRDVWDHKPPLIYYINLAGLSATNGSRWGVWALEFAAVSSAVLSGYFLLRRAFGLTIALLVTGMWLLAFFTLIEDGNLTETFALPLQFTCLALACDIETTQRGKYRWRGVALGLLVGLIFWLKPNQVGVGFAIGLYVLAQAARRRRWRAAFGKIGTMLAGFAAVTAMVLLPFALWGALGDLFQTVFVFNYIYSRRFAFIASRIDALIAGYQYLSGTGLLLLGMFGFVLGAIVLLWARARLAQYPRVLLEISGLALPIEIVLVTASGRSFDHYFVALLYVLAVWTAWLLWILRAGILLWLETNGVLGQKLVSAGLALGVFVLCLPALYQDVSLAQKLHAQQPSQMVAFIQNHTTPQDTVLIWGLETRMLFFADRRAPTKFPHTIAFEHPLYATPPLVEQYFSEILDKKPALIVDSRGYGLNNFTPARSHTLNRLINRLQHAYRPAGKIEDMTIYERVTP